MLETIFKIKKFKLYAIITVSVILMILCSFVLTAGKYTQENLSQRIFTETYVTNEGGGSMNGYNNYRALSDQKTDEYVEFLLENGYNTSIYSESQLPRIRQQVQFYIQLSKSLEETVVEGAGSSPNCKRNISGDYSSDLCDYTGIVVHNYTGAIISNESEHKVGGRILGKYPDILLATTLSYNSTLLEENNYNNNSSDESFWDNFLKNLFTFLSEPPTEVLISKMVSEKKLYSTFEFGMGSTCEADDIEGYYSAKVPEDYICYDGTICVEKETGEFDEEGNPITECIYPDNRYIDHNTGTKYCHYNGEPGSQGYALGITWICNVKKPLPNITCDSVSTIKDDLGNELYYKCSGINESLVRTEIVDPIFDAYEKNKLSGDLKNPNNFKIDEETRNIVTKHIVMEIMGNTESRDNAISDKNGNFYLQSYNTVLNKEQYKYYLKNEFFNKEQFAIDLYGRNLSEMSINNLINVIFDTYDYISVFEYTNDSNSNVDGSGLGQADPSGYRVRKSMPYYGSEEYNKYYSSGLYGECAWYALGRVKEILGTAGSSYKWTENANGADWCNISHAKDFITTTDYTKPKKGSVISWGGGNGNNYGHVAIIEEVYYDKNGTAVSVDISEGGLNINQSAPQLYSSEYIWQNDTLEIRKKQCATGRCFINRNVPVYMLKNRWLGYYFKCYIYLLKDEDVQEE